MYSRGTRTHLTYVGSFAIMVAFLLVTILFDRGDPSRASSVAGNTDTEAGLEWPLAVEYEISNTKGVISTHRFTGSSWDAWTDQEGEGVDGACLTLLPSGELMGQSLGCSGSYFIVNDGREADTISPNGEFRPLDPTLLETVRAAAELDALTEVASELRLDPAQLVTTASAVDIPCPAVLDLPCVDEEVARDRVVVADRWSGIPLRTEYSILGEVIHSITVTSVQGLESYEPDPAAVEAAAAGTALEDVLDFR